MVLQIEALRKLTPAGHYISPALLRNYHENSLSARELNQFKHNETCVFTFCNVNFINKSDHYLINGVNRGKPAGGTGGRSNSQRQIRWLHNAAATTDAGHLA